MDAEKYAALIDEATVVYDVAEISPLEEARNLSLVGLCISRHNPKLQTQTFLGVFHQMLGKGLIDRYKGLHVL